MATPGLEDRQGLNILIFSTFKPIVQKWKKLLRCEDQGKDTGQEQQAKFGSD